MAYTINYKLSPNDQAWVLDGNSVKKGKCLQTKIDVVPTSTMASQTLISYIVLLECNAGTFISPDSTTFLSLQDAIDALQVKMANPLTAC